ncbi:hypothetical protein BA022_08080 [Diaphorobacter nitroreducens]|nr:hypothetical protein BA022_08080 [Diaphorobacter nitroreducens]
MREQTLYPAWRKVVGFFAILGYIVAAVLAVSVFFSANGSTWVLLVGWGIAALVALVAKVGKELSLMLADLSDAAVHLAAGRDPGQ